MIFDPPLRIKAMIQSLKEEREAFILEKKITIIVSANTTAFVVLPFIISITVYFIWMMFTESSTAKTE